MNLEHCPFCGFDVNQSDEVLYPCGIVWSLTHEGKVYHTMQGNKPIDGVCWQLVCDETAGGCGVVMYGDSKDEVVEKWHKRAVVG